MISTTERSSSFTPDGLLTAFAFPYAVYEGHNLAATVNGSAVTNFSVSGVSDTGATVTFTSPPAAGSVLVITRTTPITQLVDYTPNEAFNAETHENALDKLTLIDQELRDDLDDAILGVINVNGTLVVGGWGSFLQVEAGAVPAAPTSPQTIPTLEPGVPAIVQEHWSAHNETLLWFYDGTTWTLKWRDVGPYGYTLKTEADLTAFLALSGDRSAEVSATIPITQAFTVPPEATLAFKAGGVLDFTHAAAECQIQGRVIASTHRIFSGFTGTPAKTLNSAQAVKIQGYFGGVDRFPEWWGAVADFNGDQGTGPWTGTDCTEGIQYALDSGISQSASYYGSRVLLTGKRYLTTATITMAGRMVSLEGLGIFRTEIHPRHATAAFKAIIMGAPSTQVWGLYEQHVRNLNVRFSDDSWFPTTQWWGISIDGALGETSEIGHFQCNGHTGAAIALNGVLGLGIWMHDLHFGSDNPGNGSASIGIYLSAEADGVNVERGTVNNNLLRSIVRKEGGTASTTTNTTTMTDTGAFTLDANGNGIYAQVSGVPQYTLINVTQDDIGDIVSHTVDTITVDAMRDGTTWTLNDIYIIQTRMLPDLWTMVHSNSGSAGFTFADCYNGTGGTDTGWAASNDVDTEWLTAPALTTAPNLGTDVNVAKLTQVLCHAGEGFPSTYNEWPHAGVFIYGTNGVTVKDMHIEGFRSSIKVNGHADLSGLAVPAGYAGSTGPYPITHWESGTTYAVGDSMINDKLPYNCKAAHTASASTEPGVGNDAGDYWVTGYQATAGASRVKIENLHSDSGRTALTVTGLDSGTDGNSATALIAQNIQIGTTQPKTLDYLIDYDTEVQIGSGPSLWAPFLPNALNTVQQYTRGNNHRYASGPFDLVWEVSPMAAYSLQVRLAAVTGLPNELTIPVNRSNDQTEYEIDTTDANVVLANLAAPRYNGQILKLRHRDASPTAPFGIATIDGTYVAGITQETADAHSSLQVAAGTHDGAATNRPTVTLTIDTWASSMAGQGFTIGPKTYYLTPDGTADRDGEINIGANLAELKTNIVAGINGSDGINTAHTVVTAAAFATNDCVITETILNVATSQIVGGTTICTETFTAGTNVFSSDTLLQVIEDSGESWGVNAFSAENGYILINTTDGSSATIISNTATTITVAGMQGTITTDNLIEVGDTFIVVKAKTIKFQNYRGTSTDATANGQSITLRGRGGLWHPADGDCFVGGRILNMNPPEERWASATPVMSEKDSVPVRLDITAANVTPTMGPPECEGAEKIIHVIQSSGSFAATMTPSACNLRGVATSIVFNSDLENIILRGVAGKWVVVGGNATVS